MAKIRVLRLLEYTYDSVETMHGDMQKWAVQGTHTVPVRAATRGESIRIQIKSTTLPMDLLEELADKSSNEPLKVKESVPIGLYVDTASRTVLLQQRTMHNEFRGAWELPGGKIKTGETVKNALAREWKEELNVDVVVGDHLGTEEFPNVFLHLFRIDSIQGTLHGQEPIHWFASAELDRLRLAPGLIKFLPIVRRYL